MDQLAQECTLLSSALVSSLADIPNGQNEQGEAPEPHPYGSPIRRSSTVRRVEDVCTPAAAPPASRRRLRGKQGALSSDSSPASSDSWNFLSQITETQSMAGDKTVFLGKRLYEQLRNYHRTQWNATHGETFVCPDGEQSWAAKRDAQRISFTKLSKKAKLKMAKALASQSAVETLSPWSLPADVRAPVKALSRVAA